MSKRVLILGSGPAAYLIAHKANELGMQVITVGRFQNNVSLPIYLYGEHETLPWVLRAISKLVSLRIRMEGPVEGYLQRKGVPSGSPAPFGLVDDSEKVIYVRPMRELWLAGWPGERIEAEAGLELVQFFQPDLCFITVWLPGLGWERPRVIRTNTLVQVNPDGFEGMFLDYGDNFLIFRGAPGGPIRVFGYCGNSIWLDYGNEDPEQDLSPSQIRQRIQQPIIQFESRSELVAIRPKVWVIGRMATATPTHLSDVVEITYPILEAEV
jgi:hypothetical protein